MKPWVVTAMSVLAGCGGAGQVSLTAWGEDYIEQEIPASEFEDGHRVQYTKFLVVVQGFTLATRTGAQGPQQPVPRVVDVAKPGPVELELFTDAPAAKWDAVSWAIAPATNAVAAGEVAGADLERMNAGTLSLYVEGTVSKGATSKRFAWGFPLDTQYTECTNPDFGEGVTVSTGGSEVVQLTMHGDHFWYDDLQSPDAKMRGTAIMAADADQDGEVTMAELNAVPLTSLPLGQYGTGSASRVKTLGDFVTALGRTVGHFRGEGECLTTAR